jgi:superfamily II DNA/RNA helicase
MELSKNMVSPSKVTIYSCVGGRGETSNCKTVCAEGRQIIIGTVGRTANMLVGDGNGPYLKTESLITLALDEADQMLDGGYGRDLTTVHILILF